MSYNLWLPELLTDEELNLKRKYELLRKKKKEHTMHAEAVRKLAEPLPESPVKLPPAHAKQHAKKLVLAGKISLSPKAKEEKTSFKRPESKLSSATLVTSPKKDDDVNSAAEVGRAGIWSCTSMFNEAEGGIRAAQTNSTSIMNSFDFEESASLARVPKRGPSIYVYANGATLTEETLRSIFARFGKIVKIKITSPSVAFVVYAMDDCAERAINEQLLSPYYQPPYPQCPPNLNNMTPWLSPGMGFPQSGNNPCAQPQFTKTPLLPDPYPKPATSTTCYPIPVPVQPTIPHFVYQEIYQTVMAKNRICFEKNKLLQEENEDLKKQLSNLQEMPKKKRVRFDLECKEENSEASMYKEALSTKRIKCETLIREKNEMSGKIYELEKDISNLKSKVQVGKNANKELSFKVYTLQKTIHRFKDTMKGYTSAHKNELESQQQVFNNKLEDCNKAFENEIQNYEDLATKMHHQMKENMDMQEQMNQIKKEIASLTSELKMEKEKQKCSTQCVSEQENQELWREGKRTTKIPVPPVARETRAASKSGLKLQPDNTVASLERMNTCQANDAHPIPVVDIEREDQAPTSSASSEKTSNGTTRDSYNGNTASSPRKPYDDMTKKELVARLSLSEANTQRLTKNQQTMNRKESLLHKENETLTKQLYDSLQKADAERTRAEDIYEKYSKTTLFNNVAEESARQSLFREKHFEESVQKIKTESDKKVEELLTELRDSSKEIAFLERKLEQAKRPLEKANNDFRSIIRTLSTALEMFVELDGADQKLGLLGESVTKTFNEAMKDQRNESTEFEVAKKIAKVDEEMNE
ncbi:unnamed protein product [Orchesella dallaii]|uniref:RRM domain-containing protein n=1 Tax=Orchesella dallaii TaxID=48710 RepID=A0ABP1RRN4_9HEXA